MLLLTVGHWKIQVGSGLSWNDAPNMCCENWSTGSEVHTGFMQLGLVINLPPFFSFFLSSFLPFLQKVMCTKSSRRILFFGPCIFIIEGRTDQRNAQINFSLINLLLFKLLRHVSATYWSHPQGV